MQWQYPDPRLTRDGANIEQTDPLSGERQCDRRASHDDCGPDAARLRRAVAGLSDVYFLLSFQGSHYSVGYVGDTGRYASAGGCDWLRRDVSPAGRSKPER